MQFIHHASGTVVEAQQFHREGRPYPPGIMRLDSADFPEGSRFFLEPQNGCTALPLEDGDWIVEANGRRVKETNENFCTQYEQIAPDSPVPAALIPTTFVAVTLHAGGEALINSSKIIMVRAHEEGGSILVFDSVLAEMRIQEAPTEIFQHLVLAPVRAG